MQTSINTPTINIATINAALASVQTMKAFTPKAITNDGQALTACLSSLSLEGINNCNEFVIWTEAAEMPFVSETQAVTAEQLMQQPHSRFCDELIDEIFSALPNYREDELLFI